MAKWTVLFDSLVFMLILWILKIVVQSILSIVLSHAKRHPIKRLDKTLIKFHIHFVRDVYPLNIK